jgi:hypothetical protein
MVPATIIETTSSYFCSAASLAICESALTGSGRAIRDNKGVTGLAVKCACGRRVTGGYNSASRIFLPFQ